MVHLLQITYQFWIDSEKTNVPDVDFKILAPIWVRKGEL